MGATHTLQLSWAGPGVACSRAFPCYTQSITPGSQLSITNFYTSPPAPRRGKSFGLEQTWVLVPIQSLTSWVALDKLILIVEPLKRAFKKLSLTHTVYPAQSTT